VSADSRLPRRDPVEIGAAPDPLGSNYLPGSPSGFRFEIGATDVAFVDEVPEQSRVGAASRLPGPLCSLEAGISSSAGLEHPW
jgi:hypothetical protein